MNEDRIGRCTTVHRWLRYRGSFIIRVRDTSASFMQALKMVNPTRLQQLPQLKILRIDVECSQFVDYAVQLQLPSSLTRLQISLLNVSSSADMQQTFESFCTLPLVSLNFSCFIEPTSELNVESLLANAGFADRVDGLLAAQS